jgi:hypothetical protein
MPDWLLGLLIAIVVVVVLLVLADQFGFGDDPALGG